MNDIIQGRYEALDTVGQRFQREHERATRIYTMIQQRVQRLRQGQWIGEAATRFYGEMDATVLPGVRRLAVALQHAKNTTAAIHKILQSAEQESARLFQSATTSDTAVNGGMEGVGGAPDASVETAEDIPAWSADTPAIAPPGVAFTGNATGTATGIPEATNEAQYQTLDNLDEETRENLPHADATWNAGDPNVNNDGKWEWDGTWSTGIAETGDYNSCGPVVASILISMATGESHSAPDVFARFAQLVQENWQDADPDNNIVQPNNFTIAPDRLPTDVTNPQFMTAVTTLLSDYGVSTEIVSSVESGMMAEDVAPHTQEVITNAIANGDVVAVLVDINDDGVVGNGSDYSIGHFVAVDGVSEDGQWVRIINPFDNQHEYYPMDYFITSMRGAAEYSNMAIVDMPGEVATVTPNPIPEPPVEAEAPTLPAGTDIMPSDRPERIEF